MTKPYAPACDRNKTAILDVLQQHLNTDDLVFEVGSGTGQHGVFFAEHMPQLTWQMTDKAENIAGINQWVSASAMDNARAAKVFDVDSNWPEGEDIQQVPAIFTANSLHIMAWASVEAFFNHAATHLKTSGLLIVYGPFNYHGAFSSPSNAQFDQWLKARDARSGIRDFEALEKLATDQGLLLLDDIEMPANNRILLWQKR